MEKQVQQQEARQAQTVQEHEQGRSGSFHEQAKGASRAAAILRVGGSVTQMRPQDALSLGKLIGNSAMMELVKGETPAQTFEPFAYAPLGEQMQPFAIRAEEPALLPQTGDFTLDPSLAEYPAAALASQGQSAIGWMGGAYGPLST